MSRLRRQGVLIVVAVSAAVMAATASADTYVVQPDGLGDYETIADAVHHARDGDVIELTDGTFEGDGNRDIEVPSRAITIRSQSGDPTACVINCGGNPPYEEHRGFHFTTDHGSGDVALEGVTIRRGYLTYAHGAGIWIEGANPEISDCVVTLCAVGTAYSMGGGVYVSDGAAPVFRDCRIAVNYGGMGGGVTVANSGGLFERCTIEGNGAPMLGMGGGVYVGGAGTSLEFRECEIVDNTAPRAGGIMTSYSTVLTDCNISRNYAESGNGGGVWLFGGSVDHCTIAGNSSPGEGGGVYSAGSGGTISHTIVAFSSDGEGIAANEGSVPTLSCCDVYGNADGDYDATVGDQTGTNDNVSVDPEFCNWSGADYTLYDTSPCLNTADCGSRVGALPEGCSTPVAVWSWGRVKGLWR